MLLRSTKSENIEFMVMGKPTNLFVSGSEQGFPEDVKKDKIEPCRIKINRWKDLSEQNY